VSAWQTEGMDEIRRLLVRINDAWLKGTPENIVPALSECFHEEVVMRGHGLAEVGRGREACAKSYEDFVRSATIRDWTMSEPAIDVWGDTATATYSWELAYEMNSQTYHDTGHDIFVFGREQGRWFVVSRLLLPSTS
jgi:hypothetical protein